MRENPKVADLDMGVQGARHHSDGIYFIRRGRCEV
jgi:hypothetical protein